MRKSKFSEQEIFSIINEAETGIGVSELCRLHGMSDATFYKWRATTITTMKGLISHWDK